MDQHLMKVYLDKIWRPYTKKAAENLGLAEGSYLVLDSFSANKTDEVKDALDEAKTEYTLLPGGCALKVRRVKQVRIIPHIYAYIHVTCSAYRRP